MKKLETASISEQEINGTAMGWVELWKKGDPNTIKTVNDYAGVEVRNERIAYEVLLNYVIKSLDGTVWLNDKYQVIRNEFEDGLVHLSIKRLDKSPLERDWRDYQQIKNQLIGEECEALELFPAESRLVDNANQFHIWGWNDTKIRIPVGWPDRMVSEMPLAGAQQRPFEKEAVQ